MKTTINKHKSTNEAMRSFICVLCQKEGMAISLKTTINKHKITNEAMRSFVCVLCRKEGMAI